MIFTESTIKISNNVSKMDSTIVLYRGDKNVEIRFTILQSPFKYSNTAATNVIESTNASYGQLVIKTPNDKPPIFSEVSATKEGTVLFTITKEMIDEIEEVGVYTFQIRLMDENKQSRATIPPVENGIEIKEPIAIEDDNTTNVVGLAKANYAVATLSDTDTPTFDDNGKYNKTNWNDGDIITNVSLNKIEDGIYTTNENVTAAKKYVDDKVTVKILPVDYNKNCATNVADLEPNSIYMSPNDAKFLYLAYEKLSGSLVGFLFTAKAHGRFIYTGVKDDTKIEIMMEGSCYTVYFKTDTVDGHVEKTVFYLTKNNTTEFTPTNDYEPATKKYVDDNMKTTINDIKGDLGTDELTTTAKDLKGAVNELNTQCKDIVNNKADKNTTDNIQQQVNNLVLGAVGDGNNAEVVQARGEFNTLNDRLNANDKYKSVTKYGYTNLSTERFTVYVGNRMGSNLVPILSGGVVSVTVVVMASTVKIQHLRYDKTNKLMKVINTKEVTGLTAKTISTIQCDFNFEADGNDYIACVGIGYSNNNVDVDVNGTRGYKFLGEPNDVSYAMTDFNLNTSSIIGMYVNVYSITSVDKANNLINKNTHNINELEFEINNLQNRCNKLERLDTFAWNDFDKSYFALVFDDGNTMLYDFYTLAHSKGVPILSACPSSSLKNVKNNVTMPSLLKNIELDGGEVLAHYFGSPTDESTDEDWIECTRNQKKALQDIGLTVRGILRADRTQANSKKGEKYCKMYFDYADSMGTSPQYNLGTRKFLIGVKTLDDMKAWIDTCCTKPGFYPICIHGFRDDEPLATVDNLTAIIEYIQSKNNTEFTTYSKMFDTFGTTKLEKRLLALENK